MFEAKAKEPRLSPNMQDVIERSHHDGEGKYYDDIDRYKYLIMQTLTNNQDILWTLHNESLETDKQGNKKEILNGDAYRNVNIFNFLKVPEIQSTVKNFICFEVDDIEQARYNESLIKKNIIFRAISHEDDVLTDWGIARHDLLGAIIKSDFDWTNIFGNHLSLVLDKGRVAENGYYYREFIYETLTPNNIANMAKNGGVGYNGR